MRDFLARRNDGAVLHVLGSVAVEIKTNADRDALKANKVPEVKVSDKTYAEYEKLLPS